LGKAGAAERADARAARDEESAEQRETTRLAAEAAAERDRQERRDIITRAEEAAAEASDAADAASATEREISDSVTFMQERLNREQQRLVQARRDTRQAAAAATRAKQTLERIRRQFS
jgi:gas vesicle protein